MFKLDKKNYDNTFLIYFYPLFDAQFVKNIGNNYFWSMQYNDRSAKYRCNIIDV